MRHLLAVPVLLLCAACGGSDGPSGPQNPANGNMSARLDGQTWTASAIQGIRSGTTLTVSGARADGTAIAFTVLPVTGPATITLGGSTASNAVLTAGSSTWGASGLGGTGSVTITALSATEVSGTFQFTAAATGQATPASRSVTNGVFTVKLQ